MAILTKVTVAGQQLSGAVTVKNVSGGLQQTNKVNPISVITGGAVQGARFDQLQDVVEGTPTTGDVVVYNASNDKYEVKSLSNTSITLDGGTF